MHKKVSLLTTLWFVSILQLQANLLDLVGDYEGKWLDVPKKSYLKDNEAVVAQVIDIGVNKFRLRLLPDFDQRCQPYIVMEAEGDKTTNTIVFNADSWNISVSSDGLTGKANFNRAPVRLNLKKVVRLSPTLNKPAPPEADVLFDGTHFDHWQHKNTKLKEVAWTLEDEGAMRIPTKRSKTGKRVNCTIQTKKGYRDCKLHLEFRCPWEPEKEGQRKGNSGVFFQDAFEVQVLNSYGLDGFYDQCGALYKVAAPKVNMAAPSNQWQTYDIEYYGPRFDESGKKIKNARITVLHNGVLIHNNQEIPHLTTYKKAWRTRPEPQGRAPITLQDHTNAIEYRNIWIIDLEK